MSTIYNPLAGSDSFLTEFGGAAEGAATAGNGIQSESAPSSLTVAPSLGSSLSDALSGGVIPGMGGISGPSIGNVLSAFGLGTGGLTPFPISRIVALILGLLLIGGGIIMFRPETVEDVRSAATAAAA